MKNTQKIILGVSAIFALVGGFLGMSASVAVGATPILQVYQGGTGSSTLTGILYGNGTSSVRTVTIGSNLTFSNGTLSASGGGGTFPFVTESTWLATSTLINFSGGIMSTASSTFQTLHVGALDVPNLTSALLVTNGSGVFAEYAGSTCSAGTKATAISALGAVTCSAVDISADTNLSGDTEIVLTGDALSIASTIARDTELPTGANPSGTIGLSAVNGVATTFLRSDGAPALSQSITPTWTGLHTFNTAGLIATASSTMQNLFATALTVPPLTSAILLTNASGVFAEYAGTGACTAGQAITALSALGASTCTAFSNFAYPFTSTAVSTVVSTSTTMLFTGGIMSGSTSTLQWLSSTNSTSTSATSTDFFSTRGVVTTFISNAITTATQVVSSTLTIGGHQVYPRWDDRMSIPSATTTDNMYRFGSCLESGGHSVTIDKVDSLIATTSSQNAVAEGISWNISIANSTGSSSPMTLFSANKTTTGTSTVRTFTTGFSTATIPAGYCYWFTPSTASTTQINQFYLNLYGYEN